MNQRALTDLTRERVADRLGAPVAEGRSAAVHGDVAMIHFAKYCCETHGGKLAPSLVAEPEPSGIQNRRAIRVRSIRYRGA